MFWVYFPELRPLLAKNEVYNTRNDAQRDSYDDLFAKRRFGSYVYQEANVYNNRAISEYAAGMDQMLEAQRIKEQLFTKEHDMWEY
jgi:gliding motility associated protien GldN